MRRLKMEDLTTREIELAMKYLADPTMPFPKELGHLSEVQFLSIQLMLERLQEESRMHPLH